MFHIENVKSKYFLLLAMALMVPYLFRTTMIWDSYWEEYYQSTPTGTQTLAFIFVFGALIARSKYVQSALLSVAGVWGIANLFPYSFNEWSNGNFESFLQVVLYVAGIVLLGKVILDEGVLNNLQITSFIERVNNSTHKVFGVLWLIIASLSALGASWLQYEYYGTTNLLTVLETVAVFISIIALFDLIHRYIEENLQTLSAFTKSLNDFSLNTYLTRRISSALYAVIHTGTLLFSVYYLPTVIGSYDSSFWVMLVGFPLLLPVTLIGAYLFIMIIRLVFEYTNALIHVAENTGK
jgi:hypothetical protein